MVRIVEIIDTIQPLHLYGDFQPEDMAPDAPSFALAAIIVDSGELSTWKVSNRTPCQCQSFCLGQICALQVKIDSKYAHRLILTMVLSTAKTLSGFSP